jgi:hypothetical protein
MQPWGMSDSADGYEKRYMAADDAVVVARQRMPPSYHAVLAVPLIGLVAAAVVAHVYALLALVPLLLLMWALFLYLRVVVSATHVHIQLGVFGPKIPIGAIEAVRVGKYDSAKYGDKAMRTASDGSTAYYVGCETGVEIVYRSEAGGSTTVFASCEEAAKIVEAVERARRAAAPADAKRASGLRVETSDGSEGVREEAIADSASDKISSR